MNCLCEIEIWNTFQSTLWTGRRVVAVRSQEGPQPFADRLPTSPRPVSMIATPDSNTIGRHSVRD